MFTIINKRRVFISLTSILILSVVAATLTGFQGQKAYDEPWPMWRYDAQHSASTDEALPEKLYLQWVRCLAPPKPAWPPDQYKLQFDRSYEPVVMDRLIYVGSMVSDSVTAYHIETGKESWRFYTDGPVRFAPVAWQGKLYFVCDDGCLYCLNCQTGKLLWKFRGGPSERRVLGNERLISTWPARGGAVIYDGKIYFTAGIWPFMGIFIHCLNAETGQVVWTNSGSGSVYIEQQHYSPAFAGVAPQGYLAATEDKLLIGSRTVPACYDRKTGELEYYHLSARSYGRYAGGYDIAVWKDWFFNNEIIYRLSNGQGVARAKAEVLSDEAVIAFDKKGALMAYTLKEAKADTDKPKAKKSKSDKPRADKIKAKGLWKSPLNASFDKIHFQAGPRVYASGKDGRIAAINLPGPNGKAEISWQSHVAGQVWSMLAAYGKLFVVTTEGEIYCFGGKKNKPTIYELNNQPLKTASRSYREKIKRISTLAGNPQGYCLLLGLDNGHLLWELLRQTKLNIIALDNDVRKVARMRRSLDEAGLYGTRVAVHVGDVCSAELPPYFAELVIVENLKAAGFQKNGTFVDRVFHCLRPFGGTACFSADPEQQSALAGQVENANLENAKVTAAGKFIALKRVGALPGSDDWTHQYGDIANSVNSEDKLAKTPLGLLWFGDRSEFTDVLPRHGHGPPEQVIGGRLFIEGINSISARDVYTGRILWKRTLKNLDTFGVYYDDSYVADPLDKTYNQLHIPGANSRGTNFVATLDKVYVVEGGNCRVLEAATGNNLMVISPPDSNDDKKREWGYIGVYNDYLIGTSGFAEFSKLLKSEDDDKKDNKKESDNKKSNKKKNGKKPVKWLRYYDNLAGRQIVLMNRHTGRILWRFDARHGFIHNTIAVGNGKVFCLDKLPPAVEKAMGKAAAETVKTYRMLAINIKTGKIQWENNTNIFGTWLSYSEKFDVLLQAYRSSRDMLSEPDNRMAVCRGDDGTVLWDKPHKYSGPCILHGDTIITQAKAFNLLTGDKIMRRHPLTGEPVRWEYARNYGCNTAIGSEYLLTFRSAAAGFFDLENDGGTGNLGGFKSSCTSNLVVANGVLNAPDYTRTCTCSYQNQTSLALVHTPDAEMWTFNKIDPSSDPIRRLGINFGAPGDRRAENGTLWLDYPSVGGPSPNIAINTDPAKPRYFRKHASLIDGDGLKWVAASGARGLNSITIKLAQSKADLKLRHYTVRLHFLEPDKIRRPGERIFDIALQNKTVQKNFDIVAEASAGNLIVVREFNGISANETLTIILTPTDSSLLKETILCGVEIIAEDCPK